LLVNLAEQNGWKAALCSFENSPPEHIRKLVEKRARATAPAAAELDKVIDWVAKHFFFIRFDDGSPATIEAILERARVAVLRYGIRSLVIDPYNYITRNQDVSETLYVSDALTLCRQFAAATECNVYFVAHPQKMARSNGLSYPTPTGYDISGSAAWFAKADSGLTVGRSDVPGFSVVTSWKSRHKRLGKLGIANVAYDVKTGRFSDADELPPIVVNTDDDDGFNL
jgi:twinkle protein